MKDAANLQDIIYGFLSCQIEFGAYRSGDILPSIEETSRWFSVSLGTVRSAYLRLKQDGVITLTKRAGAVVVVQYDAQEIERHIQTSFSLRRDAVIDLSRSLVPLFSRVQWFALKNAPSQRLDELERLCAKQNVLPAYAMVRHIQLIYGTLNNGLLLRLVWQAFMFFQGPFLSLPQNIAALANGDGPLLSMIGLCRQKNWSALWHAVNVFQAQLACAVERFYQDKITMQPNGQPAIFQWNAYEKSSQRCYSLALELLKDIRHGVYLQETFLPSPKKIAAAKHVSVITIRRTLALLNQLGATRSINGIGTKVLKTEDNMENCDFSQPLLQKRLLDFAQSLQILALTCKGCAENTLATMDAPSIQQWKAQLLNAKQMRQYELVIFSSLKVISQSAPIQAVREVYTQLLQNLLWGYPLCGLHGSQEDVNTLYRPHIDVLIDCLDRCDSAKLAAQLEAILCYEVEFAIIHLKELRINAISNLIIPTLSNMNDAC